MSGETEKDVSAWTIDSLRYHLEQIATDLDRRYEQRFMAQEKAIGAAFRAQDELLTMHTKLLDERYATQTKAVDAAFLAQQTAMQTALTAAERAVQTAMLASEKAVNKAEVASDKRFESVNEFRAQLADQAGTFLARTEADVRIGALGEKVEAMGKVVERAQGRTGALVVSAGALLTIITIVVIVANLVTSK